MFTTTMIDKANYKRVFVGLILLIISQLASSTNLNSVNNNLAYINKPNIKIRGSIDLWETQYLELICSVDEWNRTDYKVEWLRSDGYVISKSDKLFEDSVVKSQNEGKYYCTVTHRQYKHHTFNESVFVMIKIPKLQVKILDTENLEINGTVHRQCIGFRYKNSHEIFEYSWLDPLGKPISNNTIIRVPINDNSATGDYICNYKALINQQQYQNKSNVNLVVTDQKTIPTKLFIHIISQSETLRLGEPFSMRCELYSETKVIDYKIKYTWFKDGQLIASQQQTLVIPVFSKNDFGNYECVARGVSSTTGNHVELRVNKRHSFSIFRNDKVELTEGLGFDIGVRKGQRKELYCELDTQGNVRGKNVEWYFEDKKINKDMSELKLTRFDRYLVSLLILKNITLKNEGRYQCRVAGKVKVVNIVVLETGLIDIYPTRLKVLEGSVAEFHCHLSNLPSLFSRDIRWYFVKKYNEKKPKEVSLGQIPKWCVIIDLSVDKTSFIATKKVSKDDEGYYICRANGLEASGELVVKELSIQTRVVITPNIIRVLKRQKVEFICSTIKSTGKLGETPKMQYANGTLITKDNPDIKVVELIPGKIKVTVPYGFIEKTQIRCGIAKKESVVQIIVSKACPVTHRLCKSGECIPRSSFCDGIKDCKDGTDELEKHCVKCEPIYKPCGLLNGTNSKTLQWYNVHWTCDGENDCKNGWDEKNCPRINTGTHANGKKCNTMSITCKNGYKLPMGRVCDDRLDCDNGEDEANCLHPQIVERSALNLLVARGSTVILTCTVIGYPLPTVIWRFNWQCLPIDAVTSKRMTVTTRVENCQNVISTLTIKNFEYGDDAFYNCEAIAGTKRAMSKSMITLIEK